MNFALPDDKQWLTAAEAAEAKLPGFAFSERQIRNFIIEGNVSAHRRSGRGGGRAILWTDLPAEARAEWLKRHGVLQNAVHMQPELRPVTRDLIAEARALIAESAQAFIAERKATKAKGLKAFSAAYNNHRRAVKLDDWVFRAVAAVEPHQLRTWMRLARNGGADALLDRRGRPPGTSLFDRDLALKGFVVMHIAARPHLAATDVLELINAEEKLGKLHPLKYPTKRTLQAFLATQRTNHAAEMKALSNPDKFKSHHQVAYGSRSAQIERTNQRWEIDGTRADVMCRFPDGSLRRPAIIAVVDVFTRRMMALVVPEGSAAATKALLRRAILAWGLPEILKADNGKDFVARDVVRFCRDAGIQLKLSRAFHPEQKPFVERAFGSLNRGLLPKLPGFVGHDVAGRKAIESRETFAHRFGEEARLAIEATLTPEGLQARIDAWLRDVYEQRLHGEIGTTPAARVAAHVDLARLIPNERALDVLLMPPADGNGLRVVLKKGIRIANRWYICAEMAAHAGHHVHVRMDPHDLSRVVVYDREGGQFLFVAEDASLMDNDRLMRVAAEAHAVQRKHLRMIRNNVRTVQREFPPEHAADRILLAAAGDGFALSPEASQAMEAAQAPRLVEHNRALAAMDEHTRGPQHIAPTAEDEEGAKIILEGLAARDAAPAEQVSQRDGYTRPAFIDDDIGFWHWAVARRAANLFLDEADATSFDELEADVSFQLLLRAMRKETA